jgi:hypothetical protein
MRAESHLQNAISRLKRKLTESKRCQRTLAERIKKNDAELKKHKAWQVKSDQYSQS